MSGYLNGNFNGPRQISGSGVRVYSEFNNSDFTVTRNYVQLASAFTPLAKNTPDSVFKTAYLIEENQTAVWGDLVWFTRVYASLPIQRTSSREVSFTRVGRSGAYFSKKGVLLWGKYANGEPSTVIAQGTVLVRYYLTKPTVGTPTQVTFQGQVVDYAGVVYRVDEDGTAGAFLGATSPSNPPSSYLISDVARPWRGAMWERETVSA